MSIGIGGGGSQTRRAWITLRNSLQQPIPLEIIVEMQTTVFHHHQDFQGWSLTVFIAGSGQEHHVIRRTWGWGIRALIDALTPYNPALKDV